MNLLLSSYPASRLRLLGHATSLLLAFSFAVSFTATAAEPDVMAPAAASTWKTETHPDLAAFNQWAQRHTDNTATNLAEGVRLAQARQAALAKLMKTDPARVIAAGVPAAVRATLPAAILAELETPFSAVGDYTEFCELRAILGPNVKPSRQQVKFNGRVYTAHVYGRRIGMTTKQNIFLHGVLISNEAVLDENVLRVLPAAEAAVDARTHKDLVAPAGAAASATTSGPVLAEAGGKLYRFVSDAHVRQSEATLRLLEAHRTPETSDANEPAALEDPSSISPTPDSAYTTGAKKVLVIRVDFSDFTGDPSFRGGTPDTAALCQDITDNHVKPYYIRSSYNLTTLTTTVGSKLYRMPRTASDYATNNDNAGLHSDAEALAGADFNVDSYDRVLVVFSFLGDLPGSQINYGGLAQVGARNLWVNGEYDFRVVAHELGHTYGLIHGNLWQVTDGNPASLSGSTTEYGDDFDTMGANFANTESTDFNVWYKTQLDWITPPSVQNVTSGGTYRLYRFDGGSLTGKVGLKIVKDGTRNYWVTARRNFTSNTSMTHGVEISWGYNNYSTQHNILDTQTPGNSVTDAAQPTGTNFVDTAAGIVITPVDEGGTAPDEFEDVTIDLNVNGTAPVVNSAATANGTVGSAFSYQITATELPTSYAASGLPAGLSVNTGTGLISGTPTTNGTFSVVVSAFNGFGVGSKTVTITLAKSPNAPTITSFTPHNGPVGTTVTINGTHFDGLESIMFTGNVYPGGSYNSTQITTTVPSGAQTGPITIYTSNGSVSTTTFTVGAASTTPVITSASTASGTVGAPFSYQITATNNPTSFGVQGLPAGLTANGTTGKITGTPKAAGTSTLTLNAYNAAGKGSATLTLTVTLNAPVITSATTVSGTQGTAFSYQITATGNPTSYGVQGLPAGLSVNGTTGLISGTPTGSGKVTLTVNAYNSKGKGSAAVTLTIVAAPPVITSAASASGKVGQAFSYQITATNKPTSYGVQGLPAGLTVNGTTGLISGKPTTAGTRPLTLNAYNSAGKGSKSVTLTITAQ